MRKLAVFNQISLDGYFTGPDGNLDWAHGDESDQEWTAFVEGNALSGGALIFGRITYDKMASFWPTAAAFESDPIVARRMNEMEKVVFSTTMDSASWERTTLVHDAERSADA